MQTKVMYPIDEFLSGLLEVYASDAIRKRSMEDLNYSDYEKVDKQAARDLIDDFDAINDVVRTLPL